MTESSHDATSIRALENCSYCPRLCHFACPTAHGESSETASAWGMMGLANLLRKGQLEATEELARNLSRCTSCMRCTSFCKHENPVADVLQTARADLASIGLLPDELRITRALSHTSAGAPVAISAEHAAALVRPQPQAEIGYFPGCAALERPAERLDETLSLLSVLAGAPVALVSKEDAVCCGGWAQRAGLVDERTQYLASVQQSANRFKTVVSGCASFEADCSVVPLSEFLASAAGILTQLAAEAEPETVTLHGSCLHRRPNNEEGSELRVLNSLGRLAVLQEHAIDGVSECCGGEVTYAAMSPTAAARVAQTVVSGARKESCRLVTASDRCARHMTNSSTEIVSSILDLVLERCSIPS
ncbi:MAG: Fe-S oxidoreductase [Bradymonadia bacterium]